jgi:hypothetical protein
MKDVCEVICEEFQEVKSEGTKEVKREVASEKMKDDAKLAKQPDNNFNRFQNDGSGKQLTPPSWVVKCLAPWIDPWCNNGRVMRETHSKNTSQKDFILDEDGITSNAIFEKFKKKVVTSVTPQQAKRVACVLIAKTQERYRHFAKRYQTADSNKHALCYPSTHMHDILFEKRYLS